MQSGAKTRLLLALSIAGVLVCGPAAYAQGGSGRGLDAISDEMVVQEISRYGLDDLLDRYFKTHNLSQEQQAGVRSMASIRTLLNSGATMSPAEKTKLVQRITQGADAIIPTLRDPRQLMQLATALITNGTDRYVNTLEYWGENPRTQAELRPIAETTTKVLDLCEKRSREMADKVAEGFGNNPSQAAQKEYTELDNLATTAKYTRLMSDYFRAMSLPKSDPQRAKIATDAIEGLKEHDTNDSEVQPAVRVRIGKLLIVAGKYDQAKKVLASIVDLDKSVKPAPDVVQQYEARYFSLLASLGAKKADEVQAGIKPLEDWQKQNLPQNKAVQGGAAASLAMLDYRLQALKAELATDAEARKAAEAKANAVLQQLAKDRPELRSVIFEQLVKSLPENAPVDAMDPIMLKALVQQAIGEQLKSDAEANKQTMERGVDAAREIVKRKGQPGVDAELADDVAIVLPQLLEKLGKDADAANAYLAYVQTSRNLQNRAVAVQNALAAIGRLKAANPQAPEAEALLDKAMPLAVNDFHRYELAFDLARRLHRQNDLKGAVAAYALVPKGDKRELLAMFFRMQAMKQLFDQNSAKLAVDERQRQSLELRKLSDDVRKAATAAKASATGDEKNRAALIEARARLTSAGLAKESDPAEAVQLLNGFEDSIKGLAGEDDLQAEALFLRIHSLMASGRNAEATQSLLRLLETKAGDQGAAMIFSLLTKLDSDLDVARKAGDKAKAKSLLDARAALSGPLVDWARTNKDPKIQKYTYQYMVFDAATKQQAALAEPDTTKRIAKLKEALALYDKLMDTDGLARWRQTIDPQKVDPKYGDVAVLLAKAQVLYELGDYKQAAERFGRLLEDRKLGMSKIIVTKDNEVVSEDNPQYWEVTYKLYRANVELAHDPSYPNGSKLLEDTQNGLKRLYIREGDSVGGQKWKSDFEKLRRELIPDFTADRS